MGKCVVCEIFVIVVSSALKIVRCMDATEITKFILVGKINEMK